MNKSIVIPENQITKLISHYTDLLNTVNSKLIPLTIEKNEIEAVLSQLSGRSVDVIEPSFDTNKVQVKIPFEATGYDPNFSTPKKIRFVLNMANKTLTTIEIIEAIKQLEPNTSLKVQDLSTEMSRAIANDTKYFREGENRMKYRYGLKEWKEKRPFNNGL